ncbi:MAG: hypothetical protein JSS65_12590 [Armatimonadetes bacterium]|nr:hypothetical protein [Armatimonadota bacterium]
MGHTAAAIHTCPTSGKRVYLSTAVLLTLGLVDLVATLAWLQLGFHEGNPLFAALWRMGPSWFILAKTALLIGPVALIEYVRTKRFWSAEIGTWVAAGSYAYLWVGHLLHLPR